MVLSSSSLLLLLHDGAPGAGGASSDADSLRAGDGMHALDQSGETLFAHGRRLGHRGTGSSSPGQMGIGTLTHESIRCSMARLSHAVPFLSTNATRFGQKAASRLSFLAAYEEACEDERWPQISTRGTELCLRCCNSSLTKAAARTKMPDPTAW